MTADRPGPRHPERAASGVVSGPAAIVATDPAGAVGALLPVPAR